MSNEARTAIVTGSSRGIGKAVAQRLARDGFSDVVNYAGNAGEAEKTARVLALESAKEVIRLNNVNPGRLR